jgi:hypothetical protein
VKVGESEIHLKLRLASRKIHFMEAELRHQGLVYDRTCSQQLPAIVKLLLKPNWAIAVAFVVLFAVVTSAKAWNSVGHRLVAEMVWQNMSGSARRNATELLKHHPHYKDLLTARVPVGVDQGEWAFLTAAVWPDMVRPSRGKSENITKYDLYPHAIGYPFMLAAQTNHALIEKFFIAKPDAEMVLSNAFLTFRNTNVSPQDRAVSLCWALHLCGDLHQPLHAANLVTKERPRGDELGGHHMVLDGQGRQVSMHRFWDTLPGLNENYAVLATTAKKIVGDQRLQRVSRDDFERHKTIASWVQESFRIAAGFAYEGGRLPFTHESDLFAAKVKPAQVPKLSDDYISEANDIAQQRLLLAAERLSAELTPAW